MPSSDASPDTAVFDPSEPFEEHTMDQMFPPGQSSIVVWLLPPEFTRTGQLALRFDGPDGEAGNDRWNLPPPGDELVHLTTLSLPANRYDLTVTVTILTTDTSEAHLIGEPLQCQMALEAAPGRTVGLRLVPPIGPQPQSGMPGCVGLTHSQWRDEEGVPVSPDHLIDLAGASHCGWEDVIFLSAGDSFGRVFARDVGGTFGPDRYPASGGGDPLSFAVVDHLPSDASFSGYRSNGRELWWSDSDDYVYVRTVDLVERWPKISPRPLCA